MYRILWFIDSSSLLYIKNSQVNWFGFVHHHNECFTTSSGRHFSTVATSCSTNHLLIILVVIFFRWCWHTKNDLNRNQKDNNYTQQIFHLAFWVDYDQLKSCQLSAHHGKKNQVFRVEDLVNDGTTSLTLICTLKIFFIARTLLETIYQNVF